MSETGVVAETLANQLTKVPQLGGSHGHCGVAALAVEVFTPALAYKGVKTGTVAQVHVTHDAGPLESLEVAVDRCGIERGTLFVALGDRALGCIDDLLCRKRAGCGEQRLQNQPPRRGDTQALCSQNRESAFQVGEARRGSRWGEGHRFIVVLPLSPGHEQQFSVSITNMKNGQAAKREYRMVARADAATATRERIIDATGALFWNSIGSGLSLDFSLEEVASGAGTTVQTVLRHFGSKEHLIEAAMRSGGERISQERALAPVGDVPGAVGNLVGHYERHGDLVMRMLAEEHRSPALREVIEGGRQIHHGWVTRTFAPQLGRLRGAARKRRMAQLVTVCDVYTWKLLRRDMKLGPRQVEAALIELIEGLDAH